MALLFAGLFLLAAAGIEFLATAGEGGAENPLPVEKIRNAPDDYDGKIVKVRGFVQSIHSETGRRGSEFLRIVVDNSLSETEGSMLNLTVFTFTAPRIKKGSSIIVSGTYHKTGHWGGSIHEHFIEAEKITAVELN